MQTPNLILVKDSINTISQLQFWEIPEDTSKEKWTDGHKQLLLMQQVVRKLLPKSQSFGVKQFGLDYLVETEAQFQLEFEIPLPAETPKREEESDVMDYLVKGFQRWAEKAGDIEAWEKDRLERALEILKPLTTTAERIKKTLQSKALQ
jgi:hypothetical protein